MSPKRSKRGVQTGTGNRLDTTLPLAIDAMSLLREDLRREGFAEPADALDDALVKCLKVYVDRENAKPDTASPERTNGSGNKTS
jgi:hypothetical protein